MFGHSIRPPRLSSMSFISDRMCSFGIAPTRSSNGVPGGTRFVISIESRMASSSTPIFS